jgi:predicted DNA-binding protein (MmcQ/YjbR family)
MPSDEDLIEKLRLMCMSYPSATEDGAGVGAPGFKVRGKIFAMQHRMNERPSLWCKAPPGAQQHLIASDPATFFAPPYVAQHGWIGVYLDANPDWDWIDKLIEDSYRLTAPKKLIALLRQS